MQQVEFEFVSCDNNSNNSNLINDNGNVNEQIKKNSQSSSFGKSYTSHFNIIRSDSGKIGICKLCEKTIKMKNSNTSGLKRHLKAKHRQDNTISYKTKPVNQREWNDNVTVKKETKSSYELCFEISVFGKMKYGKCRFCGKVIKMKNNNITGLRWHLKEKHPEKCNKRIKPCLKQNVELQFEVTEGSTLFSSLVDKNRKVERKYFLYFEIIGKNREKYGVCRFCSKRIQMTNSNTSGLKRHLKAKHLQKYQELFYKGECGKNSADIKREENFETISNVGVVDSVVSECDVDTSFLNENPEYFSYFDINVSNNTISGVCRLCAEFISIIDKNITALKMHLELSHPDAYKTLFGGIEKHVKENDETVFTLIEIAQFEEDIASQIKQNDEDIIAEKTDITNTATSEQMQNYNIEQLCEEDLQMTDHNTSTVTAKSFEKRIENFVRTVESKTKTPYTAYYGIEIFDNIKHGICCLCGAQIKMKDSNTTGLKRHLKAKHTEEYYKISGKRQPHDEISIAPSFKESTLEKEEVTAEESGVSTTAIKSEVGLEADVRLQDLKEEEVTVEESRITTTVMKSEVSLEINVRLEELGEKEVTVEESSISTTAIKTELVLEGNVRLENLKEEAVTAQESNISTTAIKSEVTVKANVRSEDQISFYDVKTEYSEVFDDCENIPNVPVETEIIQNDCEPSTSKRVHVRLDKNYASYYTIEGLHDYKCGICRLCTRKIKMKNSNTSGLRRHLQSKHPLQYAELSQR